MQFIINAISFLFDFGKVLNSLWQKFRSIILIPLIASQKTLMALKFVYVASYISFIGFLLGKFFDVIAFLKDLSAPSQFSNEITSVSLGIFSTLGILKAFWDVFNVFAPFLISFFLIISAKVGIKLHREVVNQLKTIASLKTEHRG